MAVNSMPYQCSGRTIVALIHDLCSGMVFDPNSEEWIDPPATVTAGYACFLPAPEKIGQNYVLSSDADVCDCDAKTVVSYFDVTGLADGDQAPTIGTKPYCCDNCECDEELESEDPWLFATNGEGPMEMGEDGYPEGSFGHCVRSMCGMQQGNNGGDSITIDDLRNELRNELRCLPAFRKVEPCCNSCGNSNCNGGCG